MEDGAKTGWMTLQLPCGDTQRWNGALQQMGEKVPYTYCGIEDRDEPWCAHIRYCNTCGSEYCEAEIVAVEEDKP